MPGSVVLVEEAALSRRHRRQAGRLIAGEWGPAWRRRGYAGPHRPEFRVLELNGAGWVVGHLSAFRIPTRPSIRLYGLGDLVVKPRYRGGGVARRVIAAVVEECVRRGAEALLVDTLAARRAFSELGFTPPAPWAYFYVRDAACHRHEHWMERREAPVPPRIELLEHGDF